MNRYSWISTYQRVTTKIGELELWTPIIEMATPHSRKRIPQKVKDRMNDEMARLGSNRMIFIAEPHPDLRIRFFSEFVLDQVYE